MNLLLPTLRSSHSAESEEVVQAAGRETGPSVFPLPGTSALSLPEIRELLVSV